MSPMHNSMQRHKGAKTQRKPDLNFLCAFAPLYLCVLPFMLYCLFLSTLLYSELPFDGCRPIMEMRLQNGMKVLLMPTEFETDEVLVKIAALGGYASLPDEERFSGEVAGLIAWESGIGPMSSDQFSVYLYEHSLDFSLKIFPFSRVIEGSSSKAELATFLKCIRLFFTQQKFTREGWKSAEAVARNSLTKLNQDYDHLYETAFLQVNTQDVKFLRPMTPADLSKVDFAAAQQFFSHSFSDPAEFVCVITGSFDLEETKKNLREYLGTIPPAALHFNYKKEFSAPFPPGITERRVKLKGRPDTITRVTFPLKVAIDESNMPLIVFTIQIIEARLRKVITEKVKQSHGIDVSYEFPLYPKRDNAWISIRFRSEAKEIPLLQHLIIEQLDQLIHKGPSESEMDHIRQLELGNDQFWMRDNYFWVSSLTNYSLWGWSAKDICTHAEKAQALQAKDIQSFLTNALSTSNYSVVIGHP